MSPLRLWHLAAVVDRRYGRAFESALVLAGAASWLLIAAASLWARL